MRVLIWPILISVFLVVGAEAQAGLQEVPTAYEKDNYPIILKRFKLLASEGNIAAQSSLGSMYANGQGVSQDYKEAALWYRKAAEQGGADAQFSLGIMYANGQGVPQDYKEAASWYRKAAEQGYVRAQYHLGVMYDNGQGVPQDYKQAAMWYRKATEQEAANSHKSLGEIHGKELVLLKPENEAAKAETPAKVGQAAKTVKNNLAGMGDNMRGIPPDYKKKGAAAEYLSAIERGDVDAQYNLGLMYANGQGVPQDYIEAAVWYRMAAEQGNANAQYSLGRMYIRGQGVEYDYLQAVKWFGKAAEQGSAEAFGKKELLKRSASFR